MKKILSIIFAFFISLTALSLTSCGCDHIWEIVSNTATCGQAGKATYRCLLCEKTKTEKSKPTGMHVLRDGVEVQPTRWTEGYTDYTCQLCGQTVRRDITRTLIDEANYGLGKVIEYLKKRLIDPNSLMYTVDCYSSYNSDHTEEDIHKFLYDVRYNSKNRFGGYVGYTHIYLGWNSYGSGSVFTTSDIRYYENICNLYFKK